MQLGANYGLKHPMTGIRTAQVLVAIVALGLTAATISGTLNSGFRFRSYQVRFYYSPDALGVAVASLTCIYVPLTFVGLVPNVIASLVMEAISIVLWLATCITLGIAHGGSSCPSRASPDYCACGKAACAMACVILALFAASCYFVARDVRNGTPKSKGISPDDVETSAGKRHVISNPQPVQAGLPAEQSYQPTEQLAGESTVDHSTNLPTTEPAVQQPNSATATPQLELNPPHSDQQPEYTSTEPSRNMS